MVPRVATCTLTGTESRRIGSLRPVGSDARRSRPRRSTELTNESRGTMGELQEMPATVEISGWPRCSRSMRLRNRERGLLTIVSVLSIERFVARKLQRSKPPTNVAIYRVLGPKADTSKAGMSMMTIFSWNVFLTLTL